MKVTPDDYGRRCQFDHFCKLVLYHEAVDYFRERKRQRGWETSFETLPLSELDTLCTIDQYPSDSFIFPAYGCELQISDGLVAAAFASLPQPGQSIISTSCILNIYLFIYSVLADVKSDIIFRNLANYLDFTVFICVITESWSLYH